MKKIKIEIKYALITAFALVIWVMAEHLLGFNTTNMEIGEYTQPLFAIVVFVLLFLGIKEKKNKEYNGHLSFVQGLKTAFYIAFFYALLQGIWFAFYTQVINPDYATLSLQFKEKQLLSAGKTPLQIDDEMEMIKWIYGNPLLQFGFFALSTTIINTIVGIIMTLFLKSKTQTK